MTRAPYLYPGAHWPVGTRKPERPTPDSPALVAKKAADEAARNASRLAAEEVDRQKRITEADKLRAEKNALAMAERKNGLDDARNAEKQHLKEKKHRKRKNKWRERYSEY